MEYRTLGSTGVQVSTHCLGAMMFGGWGNPDRRRLRADHPRGARRRHQLHRHRRRVLGRASPRRSSGKALKGRRDDVVLATKVHGPMGPGPNERGQLAALDHARGRGQPAAPRHGSHRPVPDPPARRGHRRRGDARRADRPAARRARSATSARRRSRAGRSSRRSGRPSGAGSRGSGREQPPYSIFVRQIEHDVLPVAQRYGMGVLVWSPL